MDLDEMRYLMNLLMDLDEMRYLMNHEESPLMDLDEMRRLLHHEEFLDGLWTGVVVHR